MRSRSAVPRSDDFFGLYRQLGLTMAVCLVVMVAAAAPTTASETGDGIGGIQERVASPELDVDGRMLTLGMDVSELLRRLDLHPVDDLDGVYEGAAFEIRRDSDQPGGWTLWRIREGRREAFIADLRFEDWRLAGWRALHRIEPDAPPAALATAFIEAVDRLLPGSGSDALPGRSLPAPELTAGTSDGTVLSIRLAGRELRMVVGNPDQDGDRPVLLVDLAGVEITDPASP